MRQMIWGLLAATAVMTAGAAPASAHCETFGGCGFVTTTGYGGYGYLGVAPYDRMPQPTGVYAPAPRPDRGQYYYVDQGPTYSGPGVFAPYPTYQETAVRGWSGFERGVSYPYDGGPYGNAVNHYSDAAPAWQGPAIYSYRWHRGRAFRPRVKYFGVHPGLRTHHARAAGYRTAGPGVVVAPRLSVARQEYPRSPRPAY